MSTLKTRDTDFGNWSYSVHERGLPIGTGIHFFAKGNEERRVFL